MITNYRTHIEIPLEGAPKWLSHIEITRDGDTVLFEVVKESGLPYGEARLSLEDFNAMADTITTP